MDIGSRFLKTGIIFGLAGVAVGIGMAASHDFTLAPVHAHINLVGWIGLFLAGLFYRSLPVSALGRLPSIHYYTATAGAFILPVGIGGAVLEFPAAEALAVIGSILTIIGMIMFAVAIFRPAQGAPRAAQPAE